MGFLRSLLGIESSGDRASLPASAFGAQRAATPSMRVDLRLDGSCVVIEALDFVGVRADSRDRRWVVGLEEPGLNPEGSGHGRIVIVDRQSGDLLTACITTVGRPFNAAVSNTGTVVVNDAAAATAAVAFDSHGNELLRRPCCANINNVGISACGRFVVINTFGANSQPDGNLLEVHDVALGAALFSVHPSTEPAITYDFDVIDGRLERLWVDLGPLGRFAYSATGELSDPRGYLAARLERGGFSTQIFAVDELLATDSSPQAAECALKALEAALQSGAQERDDYAAHAHRSQGEALERLGRLHEALAAYDRALVRNPKAGVKRKASSLRKKPPLSTTSS